MPITKQEADWLVGTRMAAHGAVDARLNEMGLSLLERLQADKLDDGLIQEAIFFSRKIDHSLLDRSYEVDAEYEYTIYTKVSGTITKEAEEVLCDLYEVAGWFLQFYNESSRGQPYVEVRGFDIAEKAQCLVDAALAEQEKQERQERRQRRESFLQ